MSVVLREYEGHAIAYQDDGWFNATQAAAKHGKRPVDWLRLSTTTEYIEALKRHNPDVRKTHIAKKGGEGQGTWMHPKLGVAFARWLDADFAVWCDAQIDDLIRGKVDWRLERDATKSASKVMTDILMLTRKDAGKDTAAHHFSNEMRLVNSTLKGETTNSIDRDTLSAEDLALLAHLQERNAILIARDMPYADRKVTLRSYAMDWRLAHASTPALTGA